MAAVVCRTLSRLAGIAANVITLKRAAASATDPDRSPLIQATIHSLLRPLGGERRTLEWRNRFLAWLSKARRSPRNGLRPSAWPSNGARMGICGPWKILTVNQCWTER